MFARPAVLTVVYGLGIAALVGCGRSVSTTHEPMLTNLVDDVFLDGARKQPEGAVRKESLTIAGVWMPVLLMPAPSRVTWPVRFAERVELDAALALTPGGAGAPAGVTLRIGLSDDRWYNEVLRVRIDPAADGAETWRPIHVDLTPFSGWKWSLFYRPSRIAWKLIVNAEGAPGGTLAWRKLAFQTHGLKQRGG